MSFATDKVQLGYLPSYQRIAEELGPAARVCEVGVRHGYGLDLFRALFPGGLIAGVDQDPGATWPDGTIKIVASQDDPDLFVHLGNYSAAWDLIVDDASHDGALTMATFRLLWPLVAPGGFYVVEDWMVGLPGVWSAYGGSMLTCVQVLLTLLTADGPAEDITYRYGLAVVRKKR